MKNNNRHFTPLFGVFASLLCHRARIVLLAVATLLLLLAQNSAVAGTDAPTRSNFTWNINPTIGDWNTGANWTPMSVPNDAADIAKFDSSNTTGVSLSADTQLYGIVFNRCASPFTISVSHLLHLTLGGIGISNNSGNTQNFAILSDGVDHEGLIFHSERKCGRRDCFHQQRRRRAVLQYLICRQRCVCQQRRRRQQFWGVCSILQSCHG